MDRLIDHIDGPSDLRKLFLTDLPRVAAEVREEILSVVSKNGGHVASSLGSVELAIAVHYAFDTPRDIILWDVGHQAYAHKILTGRRKAFSTLRQLGGLSGFPNRDESPEHDPFTVGHASTSISAALGLAVSRDLKGERNKIIAVIGDASLAGGMAFEALNNAGHMNKDIIVVLNDNERSISKSVGALSKYLTRIITNPKYNKIRQDVEKVLKRIPRFGFRAYRAARRLEEGLKNLLVPGMLFEEIGFRYFGPIDGHDITQLVTTFRNLAGLGEPILVHVMTKKGKGYKHAEEDPSSFHGTGPFDIETGKRESLGASQTYTEAFGEKMLELAEKMPELIAVTAAMVDGTGLNDFSSRYPGRFFDVGISEEHAVTFSAGLARGGFRPIVAIYSTFLQRAYDQIVHDICLQDLPVVLCLDRAGLVGQDGPTHHGLFDVAYLRHIPNLVFMAPKDPEELKEMLAFAVKHPGPVAIRYPRGSGYGSAHCPVHAATPLALGRADVIKKGKDVALVALGNMTGLACEVAAALAKKKVDATVINARFVRPLDMETLQDVCTNIKRVVTIEDAVLEGGFGSAVLEFIERENIQGVKVRRIGLPGRFIEHGKTEELFQKYNLTPDAICAVIMKEVIR